MYLLASFLCLLQFIYAVPIEKVMVDMSYVYDDSIQNYPLLKKLAINITTVVVGGIWIQGEEMATATHMGTHMDAPSHFTQGGLNIDQIDISNFIAPAAVINIVAKAEEDRNAVLTVEDLQQWEATTGQSLNGTIVLVNSGWGKKWHNREEFIGTTEEDPSKTNFPGISEPAALWLVDNRKVFGVGIDTVSIDKGSSTDVPAHRILLGNGLYALENVANIEKIPIYGALLHVMPMKIGQASGAPVRIIATFPKLMFDHTTEQS